MPAVSRRQFLHTLAIGVPVVLAACGGAAAPASPASSAPPKPAASAAISLAASASAKPAAAAKPANLDQLIEGAKREGALRWGDVSVQPFNNDKFHNAFKKRYGLPDSFKIDHTLKGTGDLITQIQQEVQAGQVTHDLVWVGDIPFFQGLEKAGALLDYRPTELDALSTVVKKIGFPAGTSQWWTITSYTFIPVWNKKFVKKDIRSWQDMIDPAFDKKAIQGDIRTSSTQTDIYIGLRQVLGADYFAKYYEATHPLLVFRTPEQQQKLTSGEAVITNFHISARALQAQREDKSLSFGASFPTEGVLPLPILAGVLAKAPHPNAGKLFAEFLTSQEGQQLWLDEEVLTSQEGQQLWLDEEVQWPLRSDVTYKPEVLEFLTPLDKVKAIPFDYMAVTNEARDKARAEFRQIFHVN